MSEVKIKFKMANNQAPALKRYKIDNPDYCQFCGCKLRTDKSKNRHAGPRCFEKHAMVILEIAP